jgi:hypothetical protein
MNTGRSSFGRSLLSLSFDTMVTTETLERQISHLQHTGTQEPALFETAFNQLKVWEPTEGSDESFANDWMAWINDQVFVTSSRSH